MEKHRSVFVTGGSGFVGSHVIPILVERGFVVYALARSPKAVQKVVALGAVAVEGDLLALSGQVEAALKKCRYVLHVAAYMNITVDPAPYYAINVEATRDLLRKAEKNGVEKFVYISAAPVISGSPIIKMTEAAADNCLPPELYPKTKAIAERYVLERNAAHFSTIALRPPAIWGPNNPHYDDLLENVKSGKWRWVNGGEHVLSTIHVKNLASAILAAFTSPESGKAYFVTDGDRRPLKTFFTTLLNAEGLDPGEKRLPLWIATAAAHTFHQTYKLFGLKSKPPVAPLMIRLMGKEFSVDDSLARAELGYRNAITFEEGIEEIKRLKREAQLAVANVV
ncbi:NAD(P)-dependent oxidoreductase [Lewinella sp. 4G2]|uniref:NAD-dependent epimerase/dehydratase family protein n=1 Tax=Lewinella sp. 4G2 TaxID=1803372 RepID=UPI0007B46208|nr:NAD-dependent epimerase/dehydratase family protein [Lewinella sp. 4G2]OAV45150.1 hypothetical protein A3850_011900 [Lewinella sp. 4G2]